MTMLPEPVRLRLIAAAKLAPELRAQAIDSVYTWARLSYPEFFTDSNGWTPPTLKTEVPETKPRGTLK